MTVGGLPHYQQDQYTFSFATAETLARYWQNNLGMEGRGIGNNSRDRIADGRDLCKTQMPKPVCRIRERKVLFNDALIARAFYAAHFVGRARASPALSALDSTRSLLGAKSSLLLPAG